MSDDQEVVNVIDAEDDEIRDESIEAADEADEMDEADDESEEVSPAVVEPPKKTEEERRIEEDRWYLGKIVDASEWKDRAHNEWDRAKSLTKEKKEIYDGALAALEELIRDRKRIDDRPILLKCEVQAEEPKPVADADEEEPVEPDDFADDETRQSNDWRNGILYDALYDERGEDDSVVARIVDVFAEAADPNGEGEITMDVVHRWFAGGGQIVDLDLTDEAKVEFLDRLGAWFNGFGWHVAVEYPTGFPHVFTTTKHQGLESTRKRVVGRKKKAKAS